MTRLLHSIAALALSLLVLLPGLGGSGLLDPWEMERAATARVIAGSPQVLIVDRGGALLRQLSAQLPEVAFHRADTVATQALRVAATRMGERLTHALVVDLDAAVGAGSAAAWDQAARQLDRVAQENRGVLIVLGADKRPAAEVRTKLAEARARALRRAMAGGFWRHAMPESDKDATALAPLLMSSAAAEAGGRELVVPLAEVADALRANLPSPWARVQHKVDHHAVQAPLLDTWLVAASLDLFGSSEVAARLPGALLAALTALLLFIAMARIYGLEAAWMALLVFLTLPLMLGNARLVTLAQTAPLGVTLTTFGLALGVTGKARSWPVWLVVGLAVLFLGRGLGGLTMGAVICVGYVAITADLRRGPVLAALGAALALGVAAAVVLGDDGSALLRSFRFTQMPFGGGVPAAKRDFSAIVGLVGFSLYPWGALFLLGMGRLLIAGPLGDGNDEADAADTAEGRARVALIMGFAAPLLLVVALLPNFQQLLVPVSAVVAAVTALFLRDIRLGRAGGPVLTLLIVIPTMLLHREIGKEASTLVRWLAWDPPFGGDTAVYQWPQELKMNRGLRAIAFLSVFGFALGLARPVAWLRRTVRRLERPAATAWLLGGLGVVWTLDALISLGTRTDVLLRAEALRTGYTYDRVWTVIQTTRPEVVAGGAAFAALLLGAALASQARAAARPWRWLVALGGVVRRNRVVPVALVAVAALAQLVTGALVWTQQHHGGFGGALAAGLMSAAFVLPALVAMLGAALCWWISWREINGRHHRENAETSADQRPAGAAGDVAGGGGGLLAGAARSLRGGFMVVLAVGMLVALGGVGVGACQAAGTWSYAYLAATWALAVAVVWVIGGRVGSDRGGWGLGALAVAVVTAGTLAAVLISRLAPLEPQLGRYLLRVAIAAPDSALWVVLMALVWGNYLARSSLVVELLRYTGLELASLIERPRVATALPLLAAMVLSGGYAFGLLPELSVHFSQKHLLQRTGIQTTTGGAALDDNGVPRIFKYAPGGRHTIASNFYTQTMPSLADRAATIALLGGKNVATRVSDVGPEGRSMVVAVPGWNAKNDADKDGKRDYTAWFGVAKEAGGKRVEVAGQPWQGESWQGATLYNGRGQRSVVVSSEANTLMLRDEVVLLPGDPARGSFAVDKAPTAAAVSGKVDPNASAMKQVQRFVVVPKDSFSELNFHYRRAHKGRQIPVVDASSSRLVLTATHLKPGQRDDSWIGKHILTRATFNSLKGITRTEVNFDDKVFIIGYKLAEPTVRRSKKYKLTLFFEVRHGLASSYMIFMHPHPLHRDLWPLAIHPQTKREGKRCTGCFQTNHWLKGDIISVDIEQEVPLGTPAGSHDIIMGLFNPLNDKRLILKSATGPGVVRHNDNRVTLGKLVVR